MNITEQSKELTPKETYLLTKAPNIRKFSDVVGKQIEVKAWCVYEENSKKQGEEDKVMTILSVTNGEETFATNSPTFIESFFDIVSIFGEFGFKINVIEGTSKNGRKFIQCVYND